MQVRISSFLSVQRSEQLLIKTCSNKIKKTVVKNYKAEANVILIIFKSFSFFISDNQITLYAFSLNCFTALN